MYDIIRFYADSRERHNIKVVDTLEEAQEHCQDPETSSRTAIDSTEHGDWFDGYQEVQA